MTERECGKWILTESLLRKGSFTVTDVGDSRTIAKGLSEPEAHAIANARENAERVEEQAARIEALEAALRPFADVSENDIGSVEMDCDRFQPMREFNQAPLLTVGDLRRAAAALTQGESKTEGDPGNG